MGLKAWLQRLRRDLGLQLLALYLLLVVPVVVAALVFARFADARLHHEVEAADLALAEAIAQETNTAMEIALQSVRNLANYPAVIRADNAGMETLFGEVLSVKPDVNLIYRLGPDGIMLFHYPTGPGSTLGVDFSFRGYFQRALNSREPLVSLGRISPTTEQPVATAVMPLWEGAENFIGVVATNIKLQFLSDTLVSIVSEHSMSENLQVLIIDSAGKVIGHPDPQVLLSDLGELLPGVTDAVLAGEAGNQIDVGPENKETLYSYVPVPSAGWGVIVSRPTSVAFATSRSLHQGVYLTIAVFLGIGLLFWWVLSSRVMQPLEGLAEYSQRLGKEKGLSERGAHSLQGITRRRDQMGYLVRSFVRMEKAIRARISELSTLLETSATVVSTLDYKAVLTGILEQLERLMGIRISAIVQLDAESGVFRAQATQGLSQRYAERLVIDPKERTSVTMRALRIGEPVQISDTETNPSYAAFRSRARAEGYRSIMSIPLNTVHAPPSALVIYDPKPRVFTEQEIDLLNSFANHAAMAIENAALFARSDARLKEQTRRLEALIQSLEDGLLLEDLNGRILYANRRISELTGLPAEDLKGGQVEALLEKISAKAVDPEKAVPRFRAFLHEENTDMIEFALEHPAGKRHLRLKGFTVTEPSGHLIGRGKIFQDITKRHEIDRMKSSLVATVSHELRTPLAGIKGYASTLLAEDVSWDPKTQHEFLDIISSEADRLSVLVDELLDISRIEAGSLRLSKRSCDLRELVELGMQRASPSPGDRLQIDIPSQIPKLMADPQRIGAVLRNLIENAAKYSEDHSPIRVRAACHQGRVIVQVEDEGPGIPLESQERIFSSFYRVQNGLTREKPGAGLGLAICRGFVKAHGGEIWLEPRPQGTCVAFSLPLTEQPSSPHGET